MSSGASQPHVRKADGNLIYYFSQFRMRGFKRLDGHAFNPFVEASMSFLVSSHGEWLPCAEVSINLAPRGRLLRETTGQGAHSLLLKQPSSLRALAFFRLWNVGGFFQPCFDFLNAIFDHKLLEEGWRSSGDLPVLRFRV